MLKSTSINCSNLTEGTDGVDGTTSSPESKDNRVSFAVIHPSVTKHP